MVNVLQLDVALVVDMLPITLMTVVERRKRRLSHRHEGDLRENGGDILPTAVDFTNDRQPERRGR